MNYVINGVTVNKKDTYTHASVYDVNVLKIFTTLFYDTVNGCDRATRKMASSFWKGVVGVGLFALAHAAFSAAQRKSGPDG